MAEVTYIENRRTTLTDQELADMRVTPIADEGVVGALLFTGRCPTCPHRTRDVIPIERVGQQAAGPLDDALTSIEKAAESGMGYSITVLQRGIATGKISVHPDHAEQSKPLPILVTCHCASEHPGAKGKFGCGRSWMIGVRFNPNAAKTTVTLSRPTEADLTRWSELVSLAGSVGDPLAVAQASAAKWQTALAGIFGLVGVASLLSRDTVQKLHDPWPAVLTGCVLGALLLTAVGTYCAQQAAIGFPTISSIGDVERLDEFERSPLAQAKAAISQVQTAAVLLAFSLIAGLVALAGVLLAPSADSPSTKINVIFANTNQAVCVTVLDASDKAGFLRYQLGDAAPRWIRLSKITQLLGEC